MTPKAYLKWFSVIFIIGLILVAIAPALNPPDKDLSTKTIRERSIYQKDYNPIGSDATQTDGQSNGQDNLEPDDQEEGYSEDNEDLAPP